MLPNVAMRARKNQLPDPYEVITISKSWICSLKWGKIGPEIARTPSPCRSYRFTNRQGAPSVNWISDFLTFLFSHVFPLLESPFYQRSCPLATLRGALGLTKVDNGSSGKVFPTFYPLGFHRFELHCTVPWSGTSLEVQTGGDRQIQIGGQTGTNLKGRIVGNNPIALLKIENSV